MIVPRVVFLLEFAEVRVFEFESLSLCETAIRDSQVFSVSRYPVYLSLRSARV